MAAWPAPDDVGAYVPPTKYGPAPTPHEVAAQAAENRAGEGLPTDAESVRRAVDNSSRPDYPLPGLFYTPEELADLAAVDHALPDRARARFDGAPDDLFELALCWQDGRRAMRVTVTRDLERYRDLLIECLGADRVTVTSTPFSLRELEALQGRVHADFDELRALGVEVGFSSFGPEEGLEVGYFAADRDHGSTVLRDRYGPALTPVWIAPEWLGEEPQPFASWVNDGNGLTVFYPLPRNGEEPGGCTVEEQPDRVIVRLTIRAPQGCRTLIGGFKPSHATVRLSEPLGERIVVDDATGEPRPRWTGPARPN